MIAAAAIKEAITPVLEAQQLFLIDIHVGAKNQIKIEVDGLAGLPISDCVKINRAVEAQFDRDVEDYALEVTSPGLDQPFKVWEQYKKNVGREVDLVLNNGEKRSGLLQEVTTTDITLVKEEKKKIEGTKKKEWVTITRNFEFNDIKSAVVKLKF